MGRLKTGFLPLEKNIPQYEAFLFAPEVVLVFDIG